MSIPPPGRPPEQHRAEHHHHYHGAAAPQRARTSRAAWVALAIIVLLGVGWTASGAGTDEPGTGVSSVPAAAEAAPAEPETVTANGFPGEGTFLVNDEVQPGSYRAAVAAGSTHCYWERKSDLTGDGIIDNGLTEGGPVLMTVKARDVAVEVSGCSRFKRLP